MYICKISNGTQPSCIVDAICCPQKNTIWYYNTYNLLVWNMMFPLYSNNSLIDIYFYYKENYQYSHIINLTNINIGVGYHIFYIDDKWFPTSLSLGDTKVWNYTLLIVPNNVNPDYEINNKLSEYISVDFNVIQNVTLDKPTIGNNITVPTNSSIIGDGGEPKRNLEVWKIILIIICCLLIIIIISLLIYMKKRTINLRNKFKNQNFLNITDSKILQKPDDVINKNYI